jgi:hypothetical protein
MLELPADPPGVAFVFLLDALVSSGSPLMLPLHPATFQGASAHATATQPPARQAL